MVKFIAKISFSHGSKFCNPGETHEHEDADLVEAWEKAGYVEIVREEKTEEPKPAKSKKKKGE